MNTLTEARHTGGFLVGGFCPNESAEAITVASGQDLLAGEVIGKVTKALAAAPNPPVSGTGNGTMTNVRPGPYCQTGDYVVACTAAATNGGTFSVTAPDGTALPPLTLTVGSGAATNYTSNHIDFTITDGSTNFGVGATFTIAVTAGGTPTVVGTGTGTLGSISLGPNAQHGTYRLQCTATASNGGTFAVIAPDGTCLPDATVGTAFVSKHINFTIADGGTDYAVGDYFHIVVARGSNQVKTWTPSAVDGTHLVAGILYGDVDASSGAASGVAVVRDCDVNKSELAWNANVSEADKLVAYDQMKHLLIVPL